MEDILYKNELEQLYFSVFRVHVNNIAGGIASVFVMINIAGGIASVFVMINIAVGIASVFVMINSL